MLNRPRAIAVLGALALLACAPSFGEPFKQLENLAEDVTLPIETPGNGGSITIIGKNGSTYAFLTAAHVISGTARGEVNSIDLSSQTGRNTLVPATIKKDFRSDGIDLAVGTFQYSGKSNLLILPLFGLAPDTNWNDDPSQFKEVSLACDDPSLDRFSQCFKSGPYYPEGKCTYTGFSSYLSCDKPPTIKVTRRLSSGTYERFKGVFNNKQYFLKTATIGDFVVAGFSLPTRAISERVLRISVAVPQNLLNKNKDGYNLIYESTSTVPGMSGGPVLASRLCPMSNSITNGSGAYAGIIGVHGQSEEYSNTGARSGISLAIPIGSPVVISYLTSNSQSLGIPAGRSYIEAVRLACKKENTFY